MGPSLKSKLGIIDYMKRTGIVSVFKRNFWEGLHHHLTITGNLPPQYDSNKLRNYFYENLLHEVMLNKLPLEPTDVELICYPFLKRLYSFQVIVTERSTTASITAEKLKKHEVLIRYLLSNKVFQRTIWDSIRAMAPSLHGENHYINLNNPQYKLQTHEKNKLRRFVGSKPVVAVKNNSPNVDRVWRSAKNRHSPNAANKLTENCISTASNLNTAKKGNSDDKQESLISETYSKDGTAVGKENVNIQCEAAGSSPLINEPVEYEPPPMRPSISVPEQNWNADDVIEISDESDPERHTIPYSIYDDSSESGEN